VAATFKFDEDNTSGKTRTSDVRSCNWRSNDANSGTATTGDVTYRNNPITAGNSSFIKYQYGEFSAGGFTTISNGKFGHTAGAMDTGVTLLGQVVSSYTTPVATPLVVGGNIKDMSAVDASLSTGNSPAVLFSTTAPDGSTAATLTGGAAGFTQYLVTQLQTTTGAAPGDTSTYTLTLRYDEQ
jgi:hypothetical protein